MKYAGIGSRRTPPHIIEAMRRFGEDAGSRGFVLRSGAAEGADTAFEKGCDTACGKCEIYVPWANFGAKKKGYIPPNPEVWDTLVEYVHEFHPIGKQLSSTVKKIMARNCHQVLGYNLDDPVDFVMMYAPGVKRDSKGYIKDCEGGTGFAVRLAYSKGIPVYDMSLEMSVQRVYEKFLWEVHKYMHGTH